MNDCCRTTHTSKFIYNHDITIVRETNVHIKIKGSLNKFPDFFLMDNFIDSIHMKL